MSGPHFLIRLNPVDCLTLSGVLTSMAAVAMALKGYSYLATALLFIAMLGDPWTACWPASTGWNARSAAIWTASWMC